MYAAHRNERGMALAVAMFAIVIVGVLVGGALFLGTQEQRVGENQHRFEQSFGIVEAGAPAVIAAWNPDSINRKRPYPRDTIRIADRTTPGGTGTWGGSMWKLNNNLYYMELTASDTLSRAAGGAFRRRGGGARQRLGVILRVRPIQVPQSGAFTSQGNTTQRGNTLVDGTDHQPNATWTDCAAPDSVKPAFYVDGSVNITGSSTTIGDPPVQQDTAINNSTFDQFGDLNYAELAARANIKLASGTWEPIQPSTSGGVCNTSDVRNWGNGQDHTSSSPCASYFPIVHVAGDLTLKNWQGQGILLVDGDLTVAGQFEYFGIVIVKGVLVTSGGGAAAAHFHGTVLAKNQNGGMNDIAGAAKVRYSKCAILQALNMASNGALARSRSWVRLYN